jgi:hypothetical protein
LNWIFKTNKKGQKQMENIKVKTFLPVFSGFYGTCFEFDYSYIDDYVMQERKDIGLFSDADFNNIKINNEAYENDIAKSFCKILADELAEYVYKIEFESVYNPKAYNFENDSVNVSIEPNIANIREYIINNQLAFESYLKSHYSSYDGFISYHSNNFDEWKANTNDFTEYKDEHLLGSIIQFICNMLSISEIDIYSDVITSIDVLEYAENLDDVILKQDGTLFEFLTSKGISQTIAQYYADTFENGLIGQLCLSENVLTLFKEFQK